MSRRSASVLLLLNMPLLFSFVITAGFTDTGDVDTLLSIKMQLGNPLSKWKGGDPCGLKWDGVSCNGNRITSLTLSSMNLNGQLPIDIGRLSALQVLDLSYNPGLTGLIPSTLGDLQYLHTLILTGCRFSGRIPKELGKLHRLVTLDMNSNDLSGGIPPSLCNLTNLYLFDLSNNTIGGELPVELKELVNCRHFHFNKNNLSGSIPPEVFHEDMTLEHVLFDDNSFTGKFPSTIVNVSSLTVLRLDRNSLEGPIPSDIARLENINELHLSNNQLNGYIPDLSLMKDLQYLDLSNNSFEISDVPTWLSAFASLTTIVIENSNLNGQLPSEVFSSPQLERVILSNNSIDGPLSILEGSVSQQLQLIDLRYNNITDVPRGKNLTKTWALEGNPVCDSQTFLSNSPICRPDDDAEDTSYHTDMAHCGNDTNCTEDSEKVNPQSCQCAIPYVGTIVLRAPSFSTLTNINRFQKLEKSLWTQLNLTKGSVYLCCMRFDANMYLNIVVWLFPPSGRKSFEPSEIINLGFSLSNQRYRPPEEFVTYYFIPSSYIFLREGSRSLNRRAIIGIAVGAAVSICAIIVVGIYALWQRKKAAKAIELSSPFASWNAASSHHSGDSSKHKTIRVFSFQTLKMATNNFSRDNEIGSGGYGKVYKGILPDDGQMVAVKRAKKESNQGVAEFRTELELLSRVHHKNVVGLVGFCFEEGSEQMLVYDYIPNGTLRDNLSGKTGSRLDWSKRMNIALGAARGLAYLHEHADPPIIHRDVKSSNILLDDNMVAKVADFGLSKVFADTGNKNYVSTQVKGTLVYKGILHDDGQMVAVKRAKKESNQGVAEFMKSSNILLDDNMVAKVADFGLSKLFGDTGNKNYVSTQVKGTLGYLDPEYYMTQQLSHKSDVYSFGVVLLEILTSQHPFIEGGKYLVREVKTAMDTDGVNAVRRHILDPFLKDSPISQTLLQSLVGLSLRCVGDSAVNRPKMGDVVKELESIVESVVGPYEATTKTEQESPTASLLRGHHPNASVTSSISFDHSGGFCVTHSNI